MCFGVMTEPIDRRTFAKSMLFGGLLILPGLTLVKAETIRLPNDPAHFTPAFAGSVLDAVQRIADKPGSILRLEFSTLSGEKKTVFLSLEREHGVRGWMHPMLKSEGRKVLTLRHNGGGALPYIQFVSPDKGLVERLNERFNRFWEWAKERMRGRDSFTIAIQAVAAAVAVWLGATVGSAVLGGIAFLASYLVVLALIIAGAAVIVSMFRGHDSAPARREHARQIFVKKSEKFSEIVETMTAWTT